MAGSNFRSIPQSFIDQVRNSVDIVNVISPYVHLVNRGQDMIGLCPFHQEKTPSFMVNKRKQFFKCFGCGRGGNVFSFLMYQKNLSFPQSVQEVAEMAHLPMPTGFGVTRPLNPMLKIYQAATRFYHILLMSTELGERGRQYAKSRGLDPELLEHFKIGYAPANDAVLMTSLTQQGFDEDLMRQSGLFTISESGKMYDRFRDRLMFPLTDQADHVVAFSGRRLSNDQEVAKYMNSPASKIFDKSKLLFHLAEAKKNLEEEGHLILYEGYMDVISAYKAGVKSGVASMGTSLTSQQVNLLWRLTKNVIINYDGDAPGIHAAERAISLFKKHPDFNLGIVVLPDNLDPDEYVKKYGQDKYQAEIRGALPPTAFLLERLAGKYNLSNDREKLTFINEAIQLLAQEPNPVAADLYLKKLADQTAVTLESLKVSLSRELRRQRRAQEHQRQLRPMPTAEYRQNSLPTDQDPLGMPGIGLSNQGNLSCDNAQFRLLYLALHYDEVSQFLLEKQHFLFSDERFAELFELWLEYQEQHQADAAVTEAQENETENAENPETPAQSEQELFLAQLPPDLQDIAASLELANMPNRKLDMQEVQDCLTALKIEEIDNHVAKLKDQLADAKRKKDGAQIQQLTTEILQTLKEKEAEKKEKS